MNDLISRQAAIKSIEDLQDCPNGFSDTYDKDCIIGVIEEVPPIERCRYWDNESNFCGLYRPAATKHGRWIGIDDFPHETWECDRCGKIVETDEPPNYCENCGARMDEV